MRDSGTLVTPEASALDLVDRLSGPGTGDVWSFGTMSDVPLQRARAALRLRVRRPGHLRRLGGLAVPAAVRQPGRCSRGCSTHDAGHFPIAPVPRQAPRPGATDPHSLVLETDLVTPPTAS